ncbi:hypothetical protein [Nonomuraea typhae]|uniref:DUF4082 domain-containing protein n=1 Tax=Nonomuraea typhae TaxID=2603600 RepID=A0ABW7YJ27_9ACTN
MLLDETAAAISNPAAGQRRLFARSSGLWTRNSAGGEHKLITTDDVIEPGFPLEFGYGLIGCSGDPMHWFSNSTRASNEIDGARVWIPAGNPINMLWVAVRTAGTYSTSATPNQLGLYTDDGVQVATTTNDSSLFTSAGWRGRSLPSPVAAQLVGRFVYILTIVGGMSNLSYPYPVSANDSNASWFSVPAGGGKRRAFYANGTSLPASFTPSSYGTATTYVPLVGAS